MEELKPIAREALDAFASIAGSARGGLADRGITLDSFATVNEATADKLAADLQNRNADRNSNLQRLRREPAIARLVYEDEGSATQTLYLSPAGSPPSASVRVCSYMSPLGRLATGAVGEEIDVMLPRGEAWLILREKMTFRPIENGEGWDSQPAIHFRERSAPLTIRSLRELLREAGVPAEEVDAVAAWLEEGEAQDGDGNILEGIRRDALTAMQLRVAPILDSFQDRIFRLPIDSRIAVLGPPGTGKTTTMVRRLRQKLDFEYLEEDEKLLVEEPDAAGLSHANSWLLFTPTELLRLYVKDALGQEGVPAHDERLRTWDEYRATIARNALGILRKGSGGGLVVSLAAPDEWLANDALQNQIGWFEAFQAWQSADFIRQLTTEANILAKSGDGDAQRAGERVGAGLARSSNPLRALAGLADMRADLARLAARLGGETRGVLAQPLRVFAAADPDFLDALTVFVTDMLRNAIDDDADDADDADDSDDQGDDGEVESGEPRPALHGRRLVADVFRRAMRTAALRQAQGRKPAQTSRAGRILAFLAERGLEQPELKEVGRLLLLQRAAGRLAGATSNYLRRLPARYRRFRRVMRSEQRWYGPVSGLAAQLHPAELDLIVLAMLRSAREMETDRSLSSRVADRRPPLLDTIAQLRRNQVLVDEATDFSPVQLAAMAELASLGTGSLFLSGDFNQRLTRWGTSSEEELAWAAPDLQINRVSITYRQSRKLAAYARELARLQGAEVDDNAPDFAENVGYDPVHGSGLSDDESTANWLTERIREIERLSDDRLPTIAVLVPDAQSAEVLTGLLNIHLAGLNLQAKASDGEKLGKTNEIRVFPISDIKGLEFEAVFFVMVDQLAKREPDLFDRYIYVGATRAATFLGLTTYDVDLPAGLSQAPLVYQRNW
ncbi:ATP-binding domain-containing protein [Parafrankia sp. BMG5.11]|uniref:ATP-binding domain-containing protein n=1 Tax=Parafrankia sp. BMG5.11 TaxID=222540 RepID=UPI001040AEB3|nr:ATP-binding domain-containing protein [Parafrankia sp. BMG5.11]TCJ41265.1 DNA helicase UvrD [Parafrankia sp. BMG5.11]